MIIHAISDLHGHQPSLPGGDLLLLAGDYTLMNTIPEWVEFFRWLKQQPYRKKILIAGNHDGFFESGFPKSQQEAEELKEVQENLIDINEMQSEDFEYLCDSGTEFEGLKIWGTPWSLWFFGINPHCTAFTGHEDDLREKYDQIPNDLDILISHAPFMQVLDEAYRGKGKGVSVGSYELRKAVDRVKPKIFICGHIHEQWGQNVLYKHERSNTKCYNCSMVDRWCDLVSTYTTIDPEKQSKSFISYHRKCLNTLSYNEEFDSYYCNVCNEWTEKNCNDPTCVFCKDRPERPNA